MFDLLFERDREDALRVSTRPLDFPDGICREVEAYRVVWRWYDNLLAYAFAADAPEILGYVLRTMEAQGCDEREALGRVVEYLVIGTEQRGGDLTDDNLPLQLARRQLEAWRTRRTRPL
tara:strand:- start:6343 stop:6699 length:357 start_codon:yes stop_codon:yes gene_type:complete